MSRRGFTLLEVMISLLILAVGVLGLMALQVSALTSNKGSRELTEATTLARRILEMLKRDSFDWNLQADIANTSEVPLLQPASASIGAGVTTTWLVVRDSVLPGINDGGAKVDREMRPGGAPTGVTPMISPKYCIHYKLTWVTANELLFAEARVTWPREEKQTVTNCFLPNSTNFSDINKMHSVIVSTYIGRRPKPGQP